MSTDGEQNDDLSAETVSRIFQETSLPHYLLEAFWRVAPPRLTEETLRLLVRYLAHRRYVNRTPDGGLSAESLSDSQPGTSLRDRWESEGGAADELVKFTAMAEYRARRLDSVGGPTVKQLDAFWLAGGHDLTELAGFLSRVDHEVVDRLPK